MANEEHLAILKQGVDAWNQLREEDLQAQIDQHHLRIIHRGPDRRGPDIGEFNRLQPDFSGANLAEFNLKGANFNEANFSGANLSGANLQQASLNEADLGGTNLSGADLSGAELNHTDLSESNLIMAGLAEAYLSWVDLSGANLSGADLSGAYINNCNLSGATPDYAIIGATIFINVDLSSFVNAEIERVGLSTIDHRSIARSLHCTNLLPFLVAAGMPHIVATYAIDSVRALDPNGLFNLMHSTFISYGGPDEPFAIRLQETLQTNGVTTFLFKKDAVPGQPLSHVMRTGVREHERVVLVCSQVSLNRPGVLNEIELTLRREAKEGGAALLIPLALDRYVFDEWEPENTDLKEAVLERVIADFEGADADQSKFDRGIERLLQALKVPD